MRRPRKSKSKTRRLKVIRLWNYPEAASATPYLRSVMASLRTHYLDSLRLRLSIDRLSEKKATRETLIAIDDARKELDHSQDAFKDNHRELRKIDIFLLDPLEGVALIPCQHNEELAWMVFEQFDKKGLVGWRWHKDDMDVRRPMKDFPSEANATIAAPEATPPAPPAQA